MKTKNLWIEQFLMDDYDGPTIDDLRRYNHYGWSKPKQNDAA